MDKIIFTGRLGQDPEAKTSKDGKNYCRLNVAVTHYKPGGEKSTEWRNVTVFGKTSEYCIKYLKKGNVVAVEGFPSPRATRPRTAAIRSERSMSGRRASMGSEAVRANLAAR